MSSKFLETGTPAPWFFCRTATREQFCFDSVAGRYIVLCFFGSANDSTTRTILAGIQANRSLFDDDRVSFFGISTDPADEALGRVQDQIPGIRYFWDFDRAVSERYGATSSNGRATRVTYVIDPRLRVLAVYPITESAEQHVQSLIRLLKRLPAPTPPHRAGPHAPVIVVPRVFEASLCKALIDYYDEQGGKESGFMVEREGKTVEIADRSHKRRRDSMIQDQALKAACTRRIRDRLMPEIHKAFQFEVTRIERYLVACYCSKEGGHFSPHRDNTTKGTAHRRFAVSLFLNSGEYEGGLLRFPEYGRALYSAPVGGAVVFSCSLLHEATPVCDGKRYMFLPFLYDEAARVIREQNLQVFER